MLKTASLFADLHSSSSSSWPLAGRTETVTTVWQSPSVGTALMQLRGGGNCWVEPIHGVVRIDNALIVGYLMIAMACSPYVLGLFLPKFRASFFYGVYKSATKQDLEMARNAEVGWKVMYATLVFALATLLLVDALLTDKDAISVLKDCFVAIAIFYTGALIKIRHEATKLDILAGDRGAIQAWHLSVVIVMWLSVLENAGFVKFFNKYFGWLPLVKIVYCLLGIQTSAPQ